jgi:uncharacterized surface protein with fasciclin (FAS1) repeats
MLATIRAFAVSASVSLTLAVPATSQNTIADLVIAASGGANAGVFDSDGADYDILLNALKAADLVSVVADPNASLTVFAPSDRSFLRLALDLGYAGRDEAGAWKFLVDTLTTLGNGNPIPILTDVLLYHVAPGRVGVFDVILKSLFGRTIETALQGATIRPFFFILIDNEPDLDNPRLQSPINLRASNGIIHGISRVLIPVDLP